MADSSLNVPDLQAFSDSKDRARLSRLAFHAYCRIIQRWGLADRQAAELLGISPSTWESWQGENWSEVLSQEQMTRISALLGIYQDLHLLFRDGTADRWPMLKNQHLLFSGISPIEFMIAGGTSGVLDVRRHMDELIRASGVLPIVP